MNNGKIRFPNGESSFSGSLYTKVSDCVSTLESELKSKSYNSKEQECDALLDYFTKILGCFRGDGKKLGVELTSASKEEVNKRIKQLELSLTELINNPYNNPIGNARAGVIEEMKLGPIEVIHGINNKRD